MNIWIPKVNGYNKISTGREVYGNNHPYGETEGYQTIEHCLSQPREKKIKFVVRRKEIIEINEIEASKRK